MPDPAEPTEMTLVMETASGFVEMTLQKDRPPGSRRCGSCGACCTLVPVRELQKEANQRCRFQRFPKPGAGCCSVYAKAPMPRSCRLWSCMWLIDPDLPTKRPDHSHYVVDCVPDTVDANGQPLTALQIWVDKRHPDAHRDPALRAWLEKKAAESGVIAIVRGAPQALTLIPPSLNSTGTWREVVSTEEPREAFFARRAPPAPAA